LQSFAQSGESAERLTAVGDGGVNDLMVHATQFFGPLLIHLAGALFNREFVFAKDEQDASVGFCGRGGLGRGRHRLFGRLAAGLIDPIQDFAHVLDLFEQGGGDEDWTFLSGGDREAVTGTRVDLNDLARGLQFILLLQNQTREVGGILQFSDHDPFDGDVETFEDALDEIVRERTFFRGIAEEHADDRDHLGFDIDDENFFIIAHKQRAPTVGGKNTPDLNRHDVILHKHIVGPAP
jgi:hypothetical protein